MVNHEDILKEIEEHFKPLLENSPDGIYFWLDDKNMICNEQLAKMFGYSVKELCAQTPFLEKMVAKDYREFFSLNFHLHVVQLLSPITFRFKGLKKGGKEFSAETDMIPFCWNNHIIAFHFVREIKE